jgi:ABC-type ATPase involved in cell division
MVAAARSISTRPHILVAAYHEGMNRHPASMASLMITMLLEEIMSSATGAMIVTAINNNMHMSQVKNRCIVEQTRMFSRLAWIGI